jgi:Flp pilus assembly protein TadD
LTYRKDYAEALQAFQRAIELKPDNADAHFAVGMAYVQSGQKALALAPFRRVLLLNPHHPDAEAIQDFIRRIEQEGGR